MRALLVDDEAYVIEGLLQMIPWEALRVVDVDTACNGDEAYRLYQRKKHDFIVTDVSMPQMNGLEFIRKLRNEGDMVPAVILSGYDDFQYAREAIDLQITRYLLKPCVYTEIWETIQELTLELETKKKQKDYAEHFLIQVQQKMPLLREQFLFERVASAGQRNKISEDQLEFYGLDQRLLTGGMVIGIKIYRPKEMRAAAESDWQLFLYSVNNIVREIIADLDQPDACYALRYNEDRLPLLLLDSDSAEALRRSYCLAEEIKRCITAYLGLDLNVGIGRWYPEIEQYPLSYKESSEVLAHLEYEGYQKISFFDDAHMETNDLPHVPLGQIRLLSQAILQFNLELSMSEWGKIEQILLESHAPIAFIQTALIALMYRITLDVMEADHEFNRDQQPLALITSVQQLRSKEELAELMRSHISYLVGRMTQKHQAQQQESYASYIIRYVEEHYGDAISFADLAKKLHLSRNYLSYLFKRETGSSYVAYLTNHRMQIAKELLLSNRYMIYEVAEKVGYQDPAYFSKVFKGATGVSPLEFISQK